MFTTCAHTFAAAGITRAPGAARFRLACATVGMTPSPRRPSSSTSESTISAFALFLKFKASGSRSNDDPCTTRTVSAKPFEANTSLAHSAMSPTRSTVTTSAAPARAAIIARRPVPPPISITRRPIVASRIALSYTLFRLSSLTMGKCQRSTDMLTVFASAGAGATSTGENLKWPDDASCATRSFTTLPLDTESGEGRKEIICRLLFLSIPPESVSLSIPQSVHNAIAVSSPSTVARSSNSTASRRHSLSRTSDEVSDTRVSSVSSVTAVCFTSRKRTKSTGDSPRNRLKAPRSKPDTTPTRARTTSVCAGTLTPTARILTREGNIAASDVSKFSHASLTSSKALPMVDISSTPGTSSTRAALPNAPSGALGLGRNTLALEGITRTEA